MEELSWSRLRAILDRLETLSNEIDGFVAQPDASAMRKFIAHRREIADLFFQLGVEAQARFAELPTETGTRVRAAFEASNKKLRTALVDLQVNWPLPRISANIDGYREAKRRFNLIQNEFFDEMRHRILRGGRDG